MFGCLTYFFKGYRSCLEFSAGYIVEQSLSIDNLFVFLLLFNYFKVPQQYQDRVLKWGIVGAVILRGVMITVGVTAVQRFKWITLIFAIILLASAVKLLKDGDSDEDLSENFVMKITHRYLKASEEYDGDRFFTKERGVNVATPLFMCLICIELSDLVFAVDSIPAVLGVSTDPFIVYSSNIFAIMGLRSLYTLVAKAVSDLPYLRPAVALVLAYVGLKMIAEYFHYDIPIGYSLATVGGILMMGLLLSLIAKRFKKGIDIYSGEKHDRLTS